MESLRGSNTTVTMDFDHVFEIAAGTYEEFLICYKFTKDFQLIQSVANHSHKASIRTIATSKNLLVTGGSDETIYIYNLLARREQGILTHHRGTVTCLKFSPDGNFLMTGGEDGALALIRVGSWKVQHVWEKAHKGSGIISFSIHPSGKLALSIGQDKMIRTWNLITGRRAFTVSMGKKCKNLDSVCWSTEGNYFVVSCDHRIDVYSTKSALIEQAVTLSSRVTSINFLNDTVMILGEQNGSVSAYCCEKNKEIWRTKVGEERVKSLSIYDKYLVTGGSLGTINVYNVSIDEIKLITSVDSKCRITCLTINAPQRDFGRKKKNNLKRKSKEIECKDELKPIEVKKVINSNTNVQCSPASQKWRVVTLD